jgi:hypothetical protein
MIDIKAFFNISKSVVAQAAKAKHKPSLNNKAAMEAYAKAVGSFGKKASFTMEQKADTIEWSV